VWLVFGDLHPRCDFYKVHLVNPLWFFQGICSGDFFELVNPLWFFQGICSGDFFEVELVIPTCWWSAIDFLEMVKLLTHEGHEDGVAAQFLVEIEIMRKLQVNKSTISEVLKLIEILWKFIFE
jgi:hypothetical protein